ncbi:type II secretion system protein GspK [Anaeromyxobacter oryzae]|uniref:General secretion pathway protein GspK n=1 Tax=Anaeromyxobacter oryzae TaxID=2918170 RepID=A0ABM7WXV3_9BACT|nr:type II secretion system protein GspK [Anaeromyxobacter oryzae]BDG04336.1 hypothetical protein AMOR_33320 [Anaeromyxobacter oryzae]
MARTVHTRRGGRRGERGAALLVVMVAVAILTALAVDVAYDNRVRLQIAGNGRDALRAEALAKSAVNLSRLVLSFQAQLDQSAQQLSQVTSALQGQPATPAPGQPRAPGQPASAGAATGAAGDAAGQGVPRVQIWSVIPVNSGLVQALFGGGGGGAGGGAAAARSGPSTTAPVPADGRPSIAESGAKATASFGDFDGAFEAKLEDEGTKVNLQFDTPYLQTGLLGSQVEAYLRLVCDARWDAIFDREDANGQRVSRQELAVYLRDWADDDAMSSALAASFPGGGNCNFVLQPSPFEKGFSDENSAYDRGPERYRAKNARLDSLDELYLVAGVSDAFMAAFGDAVTVYLPKDAGLNVNSNRPEDELRVARMMVELPSMALLADTTFPEKLHKALNAVRMGGLLTISPAQFAAVLQGLGAQVKAEVLRPGTSQKSAFTDRSVTFRIHALGTVGDVEKRIDAVVMLDTQQTPQLQQPQQTPPAQQVQQAVQQVQQQLQQSADAQAGKPFVGQRLIHWREE